MTQPQDFPAAPGQQPGEVTGQPAPSFGGADQGPSGYGAPGQGTTGYGQPGQSPSGYGAPAQGPSGYGTPAQSPSGYGAPAQGPSGYGTPAQSPSGYGAPAQGPSGYGTPGGQAYPSYPQAGYGQPYHPGYGQYPGYAQPYQGYGQPYQAYRPVMGRKDPALAEWWRRLLARIIDGFILGVIFAPLWIPPWSTFIRSLQNIANEYPSGTLSSSPAARSAIAAAESHLFAKMVVIILGFYVVAFLYDWIQHWQWGQTIGKRALGTRVVRDDGNPSLGAGAAAGRAAIYAFAPLIPLAGSLFALLNELWLTWDPRSQCLHDKAAHTVVVKKDYRGPQPQPGGWQPGGW